MNRTTIGWCDRTWNPVTGCLGPGGTPGNPKRCSFGCYAERWANTRLRKLYLSNPNVAPGCDPEDPFSPRFWPERLQEPLRRKKPTKIFVVDMGDLVHPSVSVGWLWQIRSVIEQCPQHTFLLLTKNPKGYNYPEWPDNCWLGTTVTCQRDWDERWPLLRDAGAKVRFVSFEPLLGEIDFTWLDSRNLNWAIIGAMTGPEAVGVEPRWAVGLMAYLQFDGIPVFHKDNLDCEALGIERRREWPR